MSKYLPNLNLQVHAQATKPTLLCQVDVLIDVSGTTIMEQVLDRRRDPTTSMAET